MIDLYKCEIKKIGKPFLFTTCLCVVFSLFLYYFQYEREAAAYPESRIEELSRAQESYQLEEKALQTVKENDHEALKEYQLFLEQQLSDISLLKIYYQHFDHMQDAIQLEQKLDLALNQQIEKGRMFDRNILQKDTQDLHKRVLLAQAYDEASITVKTFPVTPTAANVIYLATDGFSVFFIGILMIMILFTARIWSQDYECRMHYQLFTLPYTKKSIYWCRSVIFMIAIVLLICFSLLALALPAAIHHGSGLDTFVIQHHNLYSLAFSLDDTLSVMPIATVIIAQGMMLLCYVSCLFSVIATGSILIKNRIDSIAYLMTAFLLIVYLLQYLLGNMTPITQLGTTSSQTAVIWNCLYKTGGTIAFLYLGYHLFAKKDG